jgi:hypothetical protein
MKDRHKANPGAGELGVKDTIIKKAVCEKYSRVATHPWEEFTFPVGLAFA